MPDDRCDLIESPDLALWRQAPVGLMKAGELTSGVFNPSARHGFVMSTDHGDKITAADAFAQYTAKGLDSAGTWKLLVSDCEAESLRAWDDGGSDPQLAESHVSVPMINFSRARRDRIATNLKARALKHQRQHPPVA